ncbi:uncharacterized protein LOC123540632 isoform X1 [Mercenaria mercenaria]|uniref:uncharacterized protein LOC123540632 isoform X1 n=1 Tax=Mercenaria mercenaria TaxID=6596 RepID=UPI00234F963C|nr:uncharacterized protein LOC123540632 isoform X1 [Mercenaria mercenaria]
MPPPRKSSPRRRERRSRSRSRSHSPRHRRRSRSHSRSPRDRRRSRSPQRRRSPERKHRSPPRRRSPSPRRRSRSPKRRSRSHSPRRRSRSKSPRRKAPSPRRRSPSPDDRNHPVKRPADSSVKRQSYRSRSPSPKRSRDERLYQDESPYEQQRSTKHSRSPVHESPYGGKMYADQSSSSKQPLFPAGSSKRTPEIDFVTIVEKGPKKQKLNKRFETLEQVAQGAFDFEENITIGIHRGPQHIELDDDEDVEVNYEFNPKTFKMLFPKKNYVKAIFDRDEIKAFHHDDILDEEAYVEKRTISIKPVDKPKSRKHDDELDYRITVGAGREGYGDRRMVHDSGSRSRPSRSSGYDDIPVTVRLDPKPDPRYEKIYRDQQRYEDQSLMQEKVHRNPNDLRYNLMRRKSEGDSDRRRDARDSHGGPSGMMDARTRIEARRQEGHRDDYPDRRDRPGDRRASRGTPPRSIERKKAPIKTDLPDFKNRPGVRLENPNVWVIGSSVVKDLKQFGETFPDYDIETLLKNNVASLVTHGEMDMKIEDMLPAVKYLLKSHEPPQMIVFQCGELNVCVGRNADVIDIMNKDLQTIKQEIPGVLLVWSQILPPWMAKNQTGSTLAKSRRRINRFMMQCFVSDDVGGAFLYHPMLRTDLKTKYHMPTSDGFLHLRKEGMKAYIYQLKVGIQYFMTGNGSIFPYMKWPLTKDEIDLFDPEKMCMLNTEHIQSLNLQKLLRFSKEQIQMLSNEQILMFHRNQLHFAYCEEFLQKLSPQQLNGLTKSNFMFLSNRQMRLFTEDPERIKWMNEEVKEFVQKRMKARKGTVGKRKKKLAEMDKDDAERNGEEKEWTLGDIMASSESEDEVWFSDGFESDVGSERDWVVESSMYLPEYDARSYGPHGGETSRDTWSGDRSYSRERGWRERYSSERDRRRSRSGSWERHRPGSSDRHRRSRSRERYRERSHSSERSSSRRHRSFGSDETRLYPGPYQVGPHPPRMMPPFVPPHVGMPPMPFPGMRLHPPFPPAPYPGMWPRVPMPPVVPVAQQPVVRPPPATNWGEGPPANASSVNTSNLTQIN